MWILNTYLSLKILYIYNIVMACNNIFFLVLTRNAFSAPFLFISCNIVFFIGVASVQQMLGMTNILEDMKDKNASICLWLLSF